MAQFINHRNELVTQAIDGLVALSGGAIARLDGYPHIKVVVRANVDPSKVALVSGGGSGHEPSHAGFVGEGMLTAAICGDVFASPSVDAILAGILAVTGVAGCLLIVKNYTGDRLNFGLAAERARALGLNVEMVIVGDDIALPDNKQPRGVAGTLFVHKIAGAHAQAGGDLQSVVDTARRVAANVGTIGMSLGTCQVPGSEREDRIPEGRAELGLGIHGEPGAEQVAFVAAQQAMGLVLERLNSSHVKGANVALLNNLGATSTLEMAVLAHDLVNSEPGEGLTHVIGPASLMTALDMHGFSVSFLKADAQDLAFLEADTSVSAWPRAGIKANVDKRALSAALKPEPFRPSSEKQAEALLASACDLFIACEHDLNQLDAKSGDGDTGSTLAVAARAIKAIAPQLPFANHGELLQAIGRELGQAMGGSSGILLAIYFSAAGDAVLGGADLIDSLKAGLNRLKEIGGAKPGDRTMIDALEPALEALSEDVSAAAVAAREGAEATANMTKAGAGRASYVGESHLIGHIDPGAEAVARLFEQLSR
jgi:dihydroxyacetone kinase